MDQDFTVHIDTKYYRFEQYNDNFTLIKKLNKLSIGGITVFFTRSIVYY
jgi:hypothetical protein